VLITSGLSKAFGMPGVRIGWVAGPAKQVAKLETYRDYTTLSPSSVSDRLATVAMEPKRREQILDRTRSIVRSQLPRLEEWITEQGDRLEYVPPVAGAITYVKYDLPIKAQALFERLRVEKSVLITPGNQFGMSGKYIRIGYGYDIEHTMKGVARIGELFDDLAPARETN
jgi:aspartate/methionine/tyrosine aminotransferase